MLKKSEHSITNKESERIEHSRFVQIVSTPSISSGSMWSLEPSSNSGLTGNTETSNTGIHKSETEHTFGLREN